MKKAIKFILLSCLCIFMLLPSQLVYADNFEVFDKDNTWSTQHKVKLIDVIVAPGSSGDYDFTVKNNGDTKKKCEVTIIDTNEYAIPLDFRMSRNGEFVLGSDTDWKSSAKYDGGIQTMEIGEADEYHIEWKWDFYTSDENDKRDTSLGNNEVYVTQTYFIKIKVYAESDTIEIVPDPDPEPSKPEPSKPEPSKPESSEPESSTSDESSIPDIITPVVSESEETSVPEVSTPVLVDTGDNMGNVFMVAGIALMALGIIIVSVLSKSKKK